jgi:mono/diheme cytochrome c family protein
MRLSLRPRLVWGLLLALVIAGGCSRHKDASAPAPAAATPAAEVAVSTPPLEPALSYELRLGKQVFRHYCQTCHGETGAGDGFNAFNVEPHPRDLSDPAFQKVKSNADLTDTIRRGGVGVGLTAMMPPWGKTLTPDQIDQVVGYIRSLKRVEPAPNS